MKEFLEKLDKQFGTRGNRVFYLATEPSFFEGIIEKLSVHGLIYKARKKDMWSRVIIEKPFGHDYNSAKALQKKITNFLDEKQIYRIDHYLGKETVQNILIFRFSNPIFESVWNNRHIDHVQITVAEDIGIGTRGTYFEKEGLLRDIVQNHLVQLLTLVAMEPPTSLEADAIRDEKVKVLQSLRPFLEDKFDDSCVRGQYGSGFIHGKPVIGYREEDNVDSKSCIETFVAMEMFIDNWRFAGVPFYLRSGKRLPKRSTEISITFKDAPGFIFTKQNSKVDANILVIRIQPDEGISLKMNCKVPGIKSPIQPVKMDFHYSSYFVQKPPKAYERLIIDCLSGDSTLFAREDEVLTSWKLFSPLLKYWSDSPVPNFPNYTAGQWGPKEADMLMERSGRKWRIL